MSIATAVFVVGKIPSLVKAESFAALTASKDVSLLMIPFSVYNNTFDRLIFPLGARYHFALSSDFLNFWFFCQTSALVCFIRGFTECLDQQMQWALWGPTTHACPDTLKTFHRPSVEPWKSELAPKHLWWSSKTRLTRPAVWKVILLSYTHFHKAVLTRQHTNQLRIMLPE